jgi:hypothetical protein
MKNKKNIIVNDLIQKNYTYELTASYGQDFASDFKPDLTPKQMLELGCFGGRYLRDCVNEFPSDWFKKAKFHPSGTLGHSSNLNYFGVDASQSLAVWRKKGWINDKYDPRGWFQWYCRYFMGRRIPKEDEKQIKRWKAMKRHIGQLKKNCRTGDIFCRPIQRQALLHWAYDSRKF